MSDQVEEVRLTCLDRLQTKKRPDVVAYFVGKLKDRKRNNEIVNLAGVALGRMKDPSAIGPLIDALVTVHKFKIAKPGGDGTTSSTFGSGPGGRSMGGGMSAGGGPTIIHQAIPQPGRARRPGGPDRPELQLRQAGMEVLVRRPEEAARCVRPAAELRLAPRFRLFCPPGGTQRKLAEVILRGRLVLLRRVGSRGNGDWLRRLARPTLPKRILATVPVPFPAADGATQGGRRGTGTVARAFLPLPNQLVPRSQSPFFQNSKGDRSRSIEADTDLPAEFHQVPPRLVVFFGVLHVLDHQRHVAGQGGQTLQIRGVVQATRADAHLAEVDVHLPVPRQVLGMATDDPRAKLVEAFVQQIGVVGRTGRAN